jgi:hypothetical protein
MRWSISLRVDAGVLLAQIVGGVWLRDMLMEYSVEVGCVLEAGE